jgi:hypothetical protein
MKANNHPIVKDLRRMLDKHGLDGVILLGITDKGYQMAASAGSDVKKCNALGPLLSCAEADMLKYEMDVALIDADK